MVCAHCRQGIQGRYTQVGKLAFHPEHFLCRACEGPIRGQFNMHQGMWLHPHCYQARYAPRCAGCGEALTGRFVKFEGQAYHEPCYGKEHGKPCAVCRQVIVGPMLTDYWGHQYHAQHAREIGACHYCDRLVHPAITGGGTTYGDGRVICRGCHKTAVHREREGLLTVERVKARMAGWGVDLSGIALPVRFIDRLQLARMLKGGPHASVKRVSGFASMATERQGRVVTKKQATIFLLTGMPLESLEATAAHELMHVWNFHHCPPHAFALEEGSCNFMSFRMHEGHSEPMRGYYLDTLMKDPHPAYGVGFRKVKRYVDRHGFEALLGLLRRSRDFPLLDALF